MIDSNSARLRAHRNNIHRYRQLLKTDLPALELVAAYGLRAAGIQWAASAYPTFIPHELAAAITEITASLPE